MKSHMDSDRPVRCLFEDTQTGVRTPLPSFSPPKDGHIRHHAGITLRPIYLVKCYWTAAAGLQDHTGVVRLGDISWQKLQSKKLSDGSDSSGSPLVKQARMEVKQWFPPIISERAT